MINTVINSFQVQCVCVIVGLKKGGVVMFVELLVSSDLVCLRIRTS